MASINHIFPWGRSLALHRSLAIFLLALAAVTSYGADRNLTPLRGAESFFYVNQHLVAFGETSYSISTDGSSWESFPNPSELYRANKLVYGNGVYLLFSSNGNWMSTDLIHFDPITLMNASDLQFDGQRFLLANSSGLWSSEDGISWGRIESGSFSAIGVGNGITVVTGADKVLYGSGTTFATVVSPPTGLSSIAYGDGTFLAINGRGETTRSSDGATWTPLETSPVYSPSPLLYANHRFMIKDAYDIQVSSDGTNWSDVPSAVYGSSFVAGDADHAYFLGKDLIEWQADDQFPVLSWGLLGLNTITTFKDKIFARRAESSYATSDGTTWEALEGTQYGYVLYSDEDILITKPVSSDPYSFFATEDGVNWQTLSSRLTDLNIFHDASGYTIFGIGSNGGDNGFIMGTSIDGQEWAYQTTNLKERIVNVIKKAGNIYLARQNGSFFRSINGIYWEPLHHPFGNYTGLYQANGVFFIKSGDLIYASEDGLRMTPFHFPNLTVHASGFFLLNGNDRSLYSANGRSWHNITVPNYTYPLGVWKGQLLLGDSEGQLRVSDVPAKKERTAVVPWIVDNPLWQSRIVLTSQEAAAVEVTFKAFPLDGDPVSATVFMEPKGLFSKTPAEIFPGLTRYSLFIQSSGENVFTSFQTNADLGGTLSPSQASGQFVDESYLAINFPYLNRDDINAIAIVALDIPSDYPRTVSLTLSNQAGESIGQASVDLYDSKPFAGVVSQLFPDIELPLHFSITANASSKLCGTSFIFNDQGQPSMDNAIPLYRKNEE